MHLEIIFQFITHLHGVFFLNLLISLYVLPDLIHI